MRGTLASRYGWTCGALLLFGGWGCGNEAHTREDPLAVARPAKIVTAVEPGLAPARTFPGKVQAGQTVDLAFRVGGPLVAFPVAQGQPVEAGQLIARIDPRDYRVQVHALEAQLAAARAQFQQASLQFERVNRLYEKRSMPKSSYDQAWAAREVAQAQAASTAEALQAARLALEDTELRAPYEGIVAEKLVENHQNVGPGEPVVRFQESGSLEIVIHLPERDVSALTSRAMKRLTAAFDALPGETAAVHVAEYGTVTDPQTRTFPVTLALDPGQGRGVLPGMTASVRWDAMGGGSAAGAVIVPLEAVFADEAGRPHVWRVRPETDTVEKVPVAVGTLQDRGQEVLSGLAPGDRVLAAGVHFVQEGQKVRPLDAAGAGG